LEMRVLSVWLIKKDSLRLVVSYTEKPVMR